MGERIDERLTSKAKSHRVCMEDRSASSLVSLTEKESPNSPAKAFNQPLTPHLDAWLNQSSNALPHVILRHTSGFDTEQSTVSWCAVT